MDIHGRALRSEGLSPADLQAIDEGRAPAGFSAREATLLAFLRRCNRENGAGVSEADVAAVLAAGVGYEELIEGVEEVNASAAMNRWAHVLDVGMEDA